MSLDAKAVIAAVRQSLDRQLPDVKQPSRQDIKDMLGSRAFAALLEILLQELQRYDVALHKEGTAKYDFNQGALQGIVTPILICEEWENYANTEETDGQEEK